MTSAALAAGLVLAGCNGDTLSTGAKANRPIPDKLVAEIEAKNMDKGSPMLVRLFKQEAELEVWKQDRTGRFALLKTYPICRWSGDLGPKFKEGDRQAPEGFYSITPAQMNPTSAYYLSFNMGYPNAYDKAWGRTGSQLMVHGDCSSRGCYAMTDEQISEIYALGRESFFGGQSAFQVQAYPFRMTPQNMAKHRNSPHMPFWKMIKEGNDAFEVTKQEPKVDFCEKKYVFNADKPENASRSPVFRADAKCPAYSVNEEIADAVRDKQREDEMKTAQLISRGSPLARSRAGIDGGMHPVFASKLPDGASAIDNDVDYKIASYLPAPGTVPSHTTIPTAPNVQAGPPVANVSSDPMVAAQTPASTPATRTASANASALASTDNKSNEKSEGFLSRLSKSVGLRGSDTGQTKEAAAVASTSPTAPIAPAKAVTTVTQKARTPEASRSEQAKASEPKARVIPIERNQPTQQANTQTKSAFPDPMPAPQQAAAAPANNSATMAGSAPTVSTGSFDNRFGFR